MTEESTKNNPEDLLRLKEYLDTLSPEWARGVKVAILGQVGMSDKMLANHWQNRFSKREAELDAALARVASLEAAIREHKEALKGCTGEAYDAKLWAALGGEGGEPTI